jgi:hypothetical protein
MAMPHTFKAHPDHPAVAYLVRLHADIGGRIQARSVESVIKIFNREYNVAAIAARRRQRTNPWFKRGTLFREALGVLRTATAPMTVREPPPASRMPCNAGLLVQTTPELN